MTPLYVLHVRPEGEGPEPDRRLRATLKTMLRTHGLRCLHAHDAMGRPLDPADYGSGSPVDQARSLARQFKEIAQVLGHAELPPDGADDVAVALASLAEQTDSLLQRLYASLPAPDGSRRPNSRPSRRKPAAGL